MGWIATGNKSTSSKIITLSRCSQGGRRDEPPSFGFQSYCFLQLNHCLAHGFAAVFVSLPPGKPSDFVTAGGPLWKFLIEVGQHLLGSNSTANNNIRPVRAFRLVRSTGKINFILILDLVWILNSLAEHHARNTITTKLADANGRWRVILDPLTAVPLESINDRSAYEYFAGRNEEGRAVWSSSIKEMKPIFEWNNKAGCVTMTYNAPLKKYLMCITDGWPTIQSMDTYILESDHVTGPWKMVTYLKDFGPQAYFVNIPSKFISKDGKRAWLCYSANFAYSQEDGASPGNPAGSAYSLSLHEIVFMQP